MFFNIIIVVLLGIVGYFGYQQYQKRVSKNHQINASYRSYRRNDSMLSNSFSNRKNVSVHDLRRQSEIRTNRESSMSSSPHDHHYYPSPSNQFIRNRNSITRTSPINYISPNSVYGFMPKTNILNGRDKHKEITREFTVKISPFPSMSRSVLHKNVSFDQKPNQSMEMGNLSNYSMLNGSLDQINETPTHASSFNRSIKRPIVSVADNDDEFLSKKYKNNLFDTTELDDSEISDDTFMGEDNFSNKKAQKRPTQNLDSENMFNSKKRIKNNEILSSYSSTSDYLNKDSLSKRKHSPEGVTNHTKVKKRTFIEELELLTSDTSPLYKNIYNTNASIKSIGNLSNNNLSKNVNNELNIVEDMNFTVNDDVPNDSNRLENNTAFVTNEKSISENSAQESSSALTDAKIVDDSDIVVNEDDEDNQRCYPIPTHIYSVKDYQYDKKKTKNRLNRFLAAVEESSQNTNIKIDKDSVDSVSIVSSATAPVSIVPTTTFSSVPKIELNSNSIVGATSIASVSSTASTILPSSSSITTTITLSSNNDNIQSKSGEIGSTVAKSTANSFIMPSLSTPSQAVSSIQSSTPSSFSSSSFPSVVSLSSAANTVKSPLSVLPKYDPITATPQKSTPPGGIQFNLTSNLLTSTPAPNVTNTVPDLGKSFAFGAISNADKLTPPQQQSVNRTTTVSSIPAVSFAASSAPALATTSQLNLSNNALTAQPKFNFQSPASLEKRSTELTPSTVSVVNTSSTPFNFGLNPTPISTVSLSTTNQSLSNLAPTFNFSALPNSTSTVQTSSSMFAPNLTSTSVASLQSNIFGLNNNSVSTSNNPLTQSSSSANMFSFGTTQATAASATTITSLPVAASQSNPSFDFSKIGSTSLTSLVSSNTSIPAFSGTVPSMGGISQNQQQQQQPASSSLFAFNTPNNASTNNNSTVNNNNSSFTFNAPPPQANSAPSSNMFAFNAPSSTLKLDQPKSGGSQFNPSSISFDFKPKGSIGGAPAAVAAISSSTGFNFSASPALSQPLAGGNTGFNFGSTSSSINAPASSAPFSFNSNPVASNPTFTFGAAASQSAPTGMFQFNSK